MKKMTVTLESLSFLQLSPNIMCYHYVEVVHIGNGKIPLRYQSPFLVIVHCGPQ